MRFPLPSSMAITVPTREPKVLTAGTGWQWDKALSDYPPADGWTLKYALRGPVDADFTAAVDGSTFEIRVLPSATANLTEGTYRLTGYVELEDGGGTVTDREVVFDGHVYVRANPITAVAGATLNERILAAIESRLEGRITEDMETIQINGRAISAIPFEQLSKMRGMYSYLVLQERNPSLANPSHKVVFQ